MRNRILGFARRDDGNVLIELVVLLPMLFWTIFGLFVFWDAHRQINLVQKATYGVADMISRRQVAVDCTYLNGIHDVMDYMVPGSDRSRMRVSSITWSQTNNRYEILWSKSLSSSLPNLTTTTLQAKKSQIPVMALGDTVILVETEMDYAPAFDVGLDDLTIHQFVVTRPRLAPRVDSTCS